MKKKLLFVNGPFSMTVNDFNAKKYPFHGQVLVAEQTRDPVYNCLLVLTGTCTLPPAIDL